MDSDEVLGASNFRHILFHICALARGHGDGFGIRTKHNMDGVGIAAKESMAATSKVPWE